MEARLKAHTDGLEASLKAHIEDTERRIMQRMDGRLDAVEARIADAIAKADHDLETRIVGEFWKWGRTSDLRTRQVAEAV
jgi:hypothetical protein